MKFFATVGGNFSIQENVLSKEEFNRNGYIEMQSECPGDEYEALDDGTWAVIADKERYNNIMRDKRKDAILEKWPQHKQFEAITENMVGNAEKLEQLLRYIESVRERFKYRVM